LHVIRIIQDTRGGVHVLQNQSQKTMINIGLRERQANIAKALIDLGNAKEADISPNFFLF